MCLGDVGIVETVDRDGTVAAVDVGGRQVDALLIALDDPASLQVGDAVLVHAGLVVERLDAPTARQLLADRAAIGATTSPATPEPTKEDLA